MAFGRAQVRQIAKNIIALEFDGGRSARWLNARMRAAIVAAHVFDVIRGQASHAVLISTMDQLLADVRGAIEETLPRFFEP